MNLLDELTIGPLAAELTPLIAAGDDSAIYAVLHRKDIAVDGVVTAHDIQQYLMLCDLLLPIEESTATACKTATRALELFPEFRTSIPEVKAKLISVLDNLVAETLIPDFTEVHKATILTMSQTFISRAEQIGINPSENDIAVARLEITQ